MALEEVGSQPSLKLWLINRQFAIGKREWCCDCQLASGLSFLGVMPVPDCGVELSDFRRNKATAVKFFRTRQREEVGSLQ